MKRVFAGAAIVLIGALSAGPASAESWTDGFSHLVRRDGSIIGGSDRAEGRRSPPGRSNLGAITAGDDERRRPSAAAGNSRSRAARYASDDEPAERNTRRSRQARTPSYSGGHSGIASYYWQRQRVASGGWFNPSAMTAAHKTLPFGTKVRVTNVNNGRSAVVTINDRGPFVAGRIIDLSKAAASAVGMIGSGLARVRMEILGR